MDSGGNDRMRLGREAEKLASDYLVSKGYAIRELNWRPQPSHYEIDIIAQKGTDMVFVEVKARRKADREEAVDAVDLRKQRFIARAADIYLRRQERMYYYRFDIIVVTGEGDNRSIMHLEDAYMPPLNSVGR